MDPRNPSRSIIGGTPKKTRGHFWTYKNKECYIKSHLEKWRTAEIQSGYSSMAYPDQLDALINACFTTPTPLSRQHPLHGRKLKTAMSPSSSKGPAKKTKKSRVAGLESSSSRTETSAST